MTVLLKNIIEPKAMNCTLRFSRTLKHVFDGADTNEDELNIGKFGSFTVFRINRPEKRNCLNYSIAIKLKEGLKKFNSDIMSSVGIIMGEGGNFCSGLDLQELADDPKFYHKFQDINLMDEFSKKPLIAAVDGYAVGTGFDLALWCDLRVVEETAVFGYFNQRFGVPLGESNARRLVQLVGRARAIDWAVTGRLVRANEAFQAGIVSRLVSCGTAYGQAVALAKSIEKFPYTGTLWSRMNIYEDIISSEDKTKLAYSTNSYELEEKIIKNARKFVDGYGRHGKSTNIK